MTTLTIDAPINTTKTHFKNINEIFFITLTSKKNKLTLEQLIKKYDLDSKSIKPQENISENIDKIVYNY